jgi:pentatricopeptide repeat protein
MNTLLHLCAVTHQPERALDIFQEMNDGAAIPNDVTYTKLISACGSREDYYLDAFRIFEMMIGQGFIPSDTTLNELLSVAGRHGDLQKAQMVWNDMMERGLTSGKGFPGAAGAALMMRVIYRLIKLRNENDLKVDKLLQVTNVESERLLDMVASSEGTGFIFSGVGCFKKELMPVADEFWRYCGTQGWNTKILADAYFAVYANAGPSHTPATLKLFGELYTSDGIPPDGRGYILLLKSLTKNDKLMREHGERIWAEFTAWDAAMETDLVGPSDVDPACDENRVTRQLSAQELEYRRVLSFRGRDFIGQAYRYVVN